MMEANLKSPQWPGVLFQNRIDKRQASSFLKVQIVVG